MSLLSDGHAMSAIKYLEYHPRPLLTPSYNEEAEVQGGYVTCPRSQLVKLEPEFKASL